MKGQHEVRKLNDQEIYDLYYTGIHLHFINNEHMYLCLHSHICTLVSPCTCIQVHSLLPFKLFSTNSRMLYILGVIYTMEYYKV